MTIGEVDETIGQNFYKRARISKRPGLSAGALFAYAPGLGCALCRTQPSFNLILRRGLVRARESASAMQLDPALYAHHLDGLDMDDADKLAFMEQLWTILSSFVDRAWGESSEQILLGIRQAESRRFAARPAADPLDSDHMISSTFNDAAGRDRR